jgi:F0F1-type ATP synthase membrane subunit b/b'
MIAIALTLLAAESGGSSLLMEYLPKIVNLAIYVGILVFILRKPMIAFFETRRSAILEDLNRAQLEKVEAQAKLAEVEARLAKLEDEQTEIRNSAMAEADAEAARMSARTDEEIRKIAEAAERDIDGALKAARADLQKFVAEKAVEIAESQIRSEMNDADRKRMLDQYADQLVEVKK